MDSKWVIMLIVVLVVAALAVLTAYVVSDNPRMQLRNHLNKIKRTHEHELKQLHRDVRIRVQQISADDLPANATMLNRHGELISVRGALEDYGRLVCEQRVAREHLKKLEESNYSKEAERLRKERYDDILATDIDPCSQFALHDDRHDRRRAMLARQRLEPYMEYFSAIHAEYKYRS